MPCDRRAVLMATAAGSLAGAGSAAEDAPALRGEFRRDAAARLAAAQDFGHLRQDVPMGVLRPAGDADLVETIRWAARRGHCFAARGQGHSVFGRGMAADGIVAEMPALRSIQAVQPDRVVVGAGATWRAVLEATLPQGLTPPVLTDYLDLSVGGTLAVGGVGAMTSRSGGQSDNVLGLEVVTGGGEIVTCSAGQSAALFDAVRAGLGQVAVILRATLRLVPAPRQVRRTLLFYSDLGSMLQEARRLAADGRIDVVQGAIIAVPGGGWTFRLDIARLVFAATAGDDALLTGLTDDASRRQASTLSYLDYLDRLAPLEATLRANGQWFLPHPWLMTFVGDAAVEQVVAAELAQLTPDALGPFGQVVVSPIRRAAITSPLLRLPAEALCHTVNLVRIPATDSAAEIARLVEANGAAYSRIRAAGGTLYPVSALPLSRDDWRAHFGPTFAAFRDAKRRFDPAGILTPGYEVF